MISNINRLRERQKKIEALRRAINIRIRNAEREESRLVFEKAGKELALLFKMDPGCSDSRKIQAICLKYFGFERAGDKQPIEENGGEQKKPSPANA